MKKPGFTLIELVIVISLLGISFGVTSDILISLVRSQTKTQVLTDLEQQSNFVSLKLEKELRNSTDVTLAGSNLTLTLQNGGLAVYAVIGNVLTRNTVPLTDNTAGIGGVTVTCTGAGGACFAVSAGPPKVVTISLRFSPTSTGVINPTTTGTIDINNTVVVRQTY